MHPWFLSYFEPAGQIAEVFSERGGHCYVITMSEASTEEFGSFDEKEPASWA
jgi:hypothetical protein